MRMVIGIRDDSMTRIMLRRMLRILSIVLGVAGIAFAAPAPQSGTATFPSLPPGTTIEASNLSSFASLVPSALAFAIQHGLKVHVTPTQRIAWPPAYREATEHYSAQVRLDDHDTMQNYVAGLPFPLIDASDPKAAVKIAYNWHWGPFIPAQINLLADQKTRAWNVDPSNPGRLIEDDANRDFRNEGSCERIVIVRYVHTLQALTDTHRHDSAIEYKQRGDWCGPEPNAYIMIQYLDPARASDAWFFPTAVRRWRRMKWKGGYPHQSCTYACASFWWEYVPPKTEAYSYQLLGEQPLLACMNAGGTRVGIRRSEHASRFGDVDCEVRPAYVLKMTGLPASEKILPAKLYVDKETYVFLGAEFDRAGVSDALAPLWRRTSRGDDSEIVLADDFYVPGDRPLFLLSLNMDEEPNVVDFDPPPDSLFNSKAQRYEPH